MKSSGCPKDDISRFKLLSYEEQMTRVLNYKVNGVYQFAKNYTHIDGKLQVKQAILKNDIGPNEGE